MKKFLLFTIVCFSLLFCVACKNNDESKVEKPPVYAQTDVILDGLQDEYLYDSSIDLQFGVENNANVNFFFGDKGLNFLFTVKDDCLVANDNSTYKNDSIEVYIDTLLNGSRYLGYPQSDDIQFRIYINALVDYYVGVQTGTDYCWTKSYFEIDYYILIEEDKNSYSIEMSIPWQEMGLDSKPNALGINFGHVDASEYFYVWSGIKGKESVDNPSTYYVFSKDNKILAENVIFYEKFKTTSTVTCVDESYEKISVEYDEDGVYIQLTRDFVGKKLIETQTEWWDNFETMVFVDLASDGGCINENDLKFVIRPDSKYAVANGSGEDGGWAEWIGWDKNSVGGIVVEVDLNGNLFEELVETAIIYKIYIPFADYSLSKKAVSIFDYSNWNNENCPEKYITFEQDGTITEKNNFTEMQTYCYERGDFVSLAAKVEKNSLRLKIERELFDCDYDSDPEDWWEDNKLTTLIIDLNGNKIIDDYDIKVLIRPSGRMACVFYYDGKWQEDEWLNGSWERNEINGTCAFVSQENNNTVLFLYVSNSIIGEDYVFNNVGVFNTIEGFENGNELNTNNFDYFSVQ